MDAVSDMAVVPSGWFQPAPSGDNLVTNGDRIKGPSDNLPFVSGCWAL